MSSRVSVEYSPSADVEPVVLEHTMDLSVPLDKHIEALCRQLDDVGDASQYALHRKKNSKYLNEDDYSQGAVSFQADEVLVLKDQIKEAKRIMSSLTRLSGKADDEKSGAGLLKRAVFDLEDHLKVAIFAEEFIAEGGMDALLLVVQQSDGNLAAYALKALNTTMIYANGLEFVRTTAGVLERLFALIYSSNHNVSRQAVALLFVVVEFCEDGFELIHGLAKSTAKARDRAPYADVVALLNSGDLDLKINALTLLNVLLKKAPGKQALKKLLLRLDEVGLHATLEKQDQISHSDWLAQLQLFRHVSGALIPASNVELSVMRSHIKELKDEIAEKDHVLESYLRHQELVAILRDELSQLKKAARLAHEHGYYIKTFAPPGRLEDAKSLTVPSPVQPDALHKDEGFLVDLEELSRDRLQEAERENAEMRQKLNALLGERKRNLHRLHDLELRASQAQEMEVQVHNLSTTNVTLRKSVDMTSGQVQQLQAEKEALQAEVEQFKARAEALGKQVEQHEQQKKEQDKKDSAAAAAAVPAPATTTAPSTAGGAADDGTTTKLKGEIERLTALLKEKGATDDEIKKATGDDGADKKEEDTAAVPPPPAPPVAPPAAPPVAPPVAPGIPSAPPAPGIPGAPPAPGVPGAPPAPGVGAAGAPMAPSLAPQPTKPERKQKPLKRLHWKRIVLPGKAALSTPVVWQKVEELRGVDVEEIERQFATKASRTVLTKSASGTVSAENTESKQPKKAALQRVLDGKRSNAVAIMLSSLPSMLTVKSAIVSLDDNALSLDNLEALRAQRPTAEEMELIKAVGSDEANWDKPEKFFLLIETIPAYDKRLDVWFFLWTFENRVSSIGASLTKLQSACKVLRNSKRLVLVLSIVVTYGNVLNGGTPKGRADGFDISFLPRLMQTKDKANEQSLLSYVVKAAMAKDSGLKSIEDEMKPVADAALSAPIGDTESQLKRLQLDFKRTEAHAKVVAMKSLGSADKFEARVTPFLKKASASLDDLDRQLMDGQASYEQTVAYFGSGKDDEKVPPSTEFFAIFKTFVTQLIASVPKPKAAAAPTNRKHQIGEKIGGGGQGMSAVINQLRGGLNKAILNKNKSKLNLT